MLAKEQLQEFVRSGGYAWPGGYQCALLMRDGSVIDAQSARENYRLIRRGDEPWWQAEAVFIHWEGASLYCDHSGREIPSAYGETEE